MFSWAHRQHRLLSSIEAVEGLLPKVFSEIQDICASTDPMSRAAMGSNTTLLELKIVWRSNFSNAQTGNCLQPFSPFFQTLQGKSPRTLGNQCPEITWFWRRWYSLKSSSLFFVLILVISGILAMLAVTHMFSSNCILRSNWKSSIHKPCRRGFPRRKKNKHIQVSTFAVHHMKNVNCFSAGLMMSQCHVGPLPWQVHTHVMTFVLLLIITGLMGYFAATHWVICCLRETIHWFGVPCQWVFAAILKRKRLAEEHVQSTVPRQTVLVKQWAENSCGHCVICSPNCYE